MWIPERSQHVNGEASRKHEGKGIRDYAIISTRLKRLIEYRNKPRPPVATRLPSGWTEMENMDTRFGGSWLSRTISESAYNRINTIKTRNEARRATSS
jgi:hypothetical protein